jgi:small ligand-binding sensory domain FIST
MPFSAALSTNADSRKAIAEACTEALDALAGPADLALIFFSPHHAEEVQGQAGELRNRLGASCLLGCNGESIVGNEQEIEQKPALSLWLARWLKPVKMEPFHLDFDPAPGGAGIVGLPASVAAADLRQSAILLLGDPFSFRVDLFLRQLNESVKDLRIMGGMASGGRGPGQCRLVLGDRMWDRGAVGVRLSGPIAVQGIVSQGCRPIGKPLVITRGQENIILELDRRPPLTHLQELLRGLSSRDQDLLQRGLRIGVINEHPDNIQRGDFLVRNPLGLDRGSGALTINDRVHVGQAVQFLIRDADSDDEDLHQRLRTELRAQDRKPSGALLFTCNRRGVRYFCQPHHDAGVLRAEAGNIPVAGFLGEGEIGHVGGQSRILGYSATVVLFVE